MTTSWYLRARAEAIPRLAFVGLRLRLLPLLHLVGSRLCSGQTCCASLPKLINRWIGSFWLEVAASSLQLMFEGLGLFFVTAVAFGIDSNLRPLSSWLVLYLV
ncbi:hypothetical protein [Synechococcus sp. UW179A]|uniref:hypothetical protein n=1 Tax=Synechococcus sp. UW179A TaxID=2575510 RepID=UPI000E0FF2F7|nr:hypothetical protein [Synechococcus sp. UW179A]